PIEGLAILCEPEDGALKITCSHQAPHRLKDQLETMLGIEGVRVVVPDVGGAFGLKGMFFPEYLITAAASRSIGRPVMWVERRREHFLSGTHGRGQFHRVELAGDETGRIRRAKVEILGDAGAYPHNGALIPTLSHLTVSGLYDIEDVRVEITTVVTNRAPTGSYRGAGRPEAAFSIERAVDAFARAAGIDPAVVRARNFIGKDQLPYEAPSGVLYDSGDYAAALARALELVGESEVRREQRERLERGANPIGLGIGAFIERAGGPVDSGEYAKVSLLESGSISVRTGSTSSGQGHETVWAQVVADVFSVDLAQIEVVAGDTAEVSDGFGTFGSRSAQAGASAAWRMAVEVRDQARDTASEMLEVAPTDLILSAGQFSVSGVPGSELSLAQVAAYARDNHIDLSSEEMFVPGKQTFPYGAHVAVVEIELETGTPKLLRFIAVDDCGNVLNPMIVEGQVHGSLTQGLGQALLEGIEYSDDGQLSTASLLDYKLPAAADVPPFETDRLVSPAPSNPLGVKGTGEAGCIGAPPAVVNAVLDALTPFGVTEIAMPLRPSRIWEAIRQART
ncbi:MAG: xanthine dehydrogenase family protein molybdopterin-binding subunit, partial [Acidimicrobiia bacterium]